MKSDIEIAHEATMVPDQWTWLPAWAWTLDDLDLTASTRPRSTWTSSTV